MHLNMSVQEILDTWYGTPFVVVICVYVHSVSKMRKLEKTFVIKKNERMKWQAQVWKFFIFN